MQLPYSEELNIEYLGRLFDNTSECYKFFWFKAIVSKVIEGCNVITYEELVDEMIADAWYMVTEYHLNLGPKDTLENVVDLIKSKYPEIKSCEKKNAILEFLRNTTDKDIIEKKRTLTRNVPYRLQAPFFDKLKGDAWKTGENDLIARINQEKRLMYYFEALCGLDTRIIIQDDWARYIIKNQEIIRGWLEYNMILYLQKRNPSVPGIADKLYPPYERKLEKVKKYWKLILSIEPIHEIYNDILLTDKNISIDHFVPWSYVAHDEMWNLNPTTKNINSAKSNNLPDWDQYFDRLAKLEYKSYEMIWKYESVHKEFDKCAKEHINSDDVRYRIYREGIGFNEFAGELKSVILPVYQSAVNCGFSKWQYKGAV
ncbi:MAG: HNH endonuclease [Lachnospiraceae bacterium]|nr:HNH endonuclease [Lachnospiraceae bacterium]